MYKSWQRALRQLSLHRVENTRKAMFYTRQRIFEYGEKNGRMLAWLAKTQNPTMYFVSVRDMNGLPLVTPESINDCFMQFFSDLYKYRAAYFLNDLMAFLDSVKLPLLATADRDNLEEDISLEEVQTAIGRLQAGKTPSSDGLSDQILF